ARQLAPYYAFLLPAMLVQPGHGVVVRQRPWQRFGLAVMAFTAFMIITEVDRPLAATDSAVDWLATCFPQSRIIGKEREIYECSYFRSLETRRRTLEALLSPSRETVGFYVACGGVDEFAAWQPWGQRRVQRVSPADSRDDLQNLGYVVVPDYALHDFGETPAGWMKKYRAVLANSAPFAPTDLNKVQCQFYLFRLEHNAADRQSRADIGN
ncbi:MAG TPA: hypothetical protein VF988_10135, partial [Verrucomicrobiae bacterium]